MYPGKQGDSSQETEMNQWTLRRAENVVNLVVYEALYVGSHGQEELSTRPDG